MIAIRIPPLIAFFTLWLQRYIPGYLVVCRGYSDDDINFTELVWEDDKDLDFRDRRSYPEFQIWLRT